MGGKKDYLRNGYSHRETRRQLGRPGGGYITQQQRKLLFVIRKQLEWSEQEHQDVMREAGVAAGPDGRRSTKTMSNRQFTEYLRHATQCGAVLDGIEAVPPSDRPSKNQMFRLHGLTNDVIASRLGCRIGSEIRKGDDDCPDGHSVAIKYVQGVIAQATSGRPLKWWTPADAARAIEALEAVLNRLDGQELRVDGHDGDGREEVPF